MWPIIRLNVMTRQVRILKLLNLIALCLGVFSSCITLEWFFTAPYFNRGMWCFVVIPFIIFYLGARLATEDYFHGITPRPIATITPVNMQESSDSFTSGGATNASSLIRPVIIFLNFLIYAYAIFYITISKSLLSGFYLKDSFAWWNTMILTVLIPLGSISAFVSVISFFKGILKDLSGLKERVKSGIKISVVLTSIVISIAIAFAGILMLLSVLSTGSNFGDKSDEFIGKDGNYRYYFKGASPNDYTTDRYFRSNWLIVKEEVYDL